MEGRENLAEAAIMSTCGWKPSTNTTYKALSRTNVSLLPRETYLNDTDVLLLRPTTYEAKYVHSAPLMRGHLYMQDPNEVCNKIEDMRIDKLTLSELYSTTYHFCMQKKQRRRDMMFPLLPNPPDFDGDTPTDLETVMRYIKGLLAVYSNEVSDPLPFQLYQTLFARFMENIASMISQNTVDNKDNILSCKKSPLLNSHNDNILWSTSTSMFRSFTHTTQLVASTISVWLQNLRYTDCVCIAMREIERSPDAARAVSASIVRDALKYCSELIMGDNCSQERKGEVCTLMGFLVLPRCEIQEILAYVDILEKYSTHTSSSTMSIVLPRYEEVLRSFVLTSQTQHIMLSPVNAQCGDIRRLPPILSEGSSVFCFCVSPCGSLLAAATAFAIILFDMATGNVLAETAVLFDPQLLWIMQFSSDSDMLILTKKSGLCHVVLNTELTPLYERNTECVAIPTKVTKKSMDFFFSPKLTSGRKSSLYFTACGKTMLNQLGCGADKVINNFIICSHINSDYVGNLIVLEAEDDKFTLRVEGRIITLTQGEHMCFGVCPNNVPWYFIYCKWNKGTWTLGIDDSLVELNGARTAQPKSHKITRVTIFDGIGHVGSLAAWSDDSFDGRSIRKFYAERMLTSSARPFLHLSLDEGMGFWVKELSTMRAITIKENCFVWDEAISCPCLPLDSYNHNVWFPEELLLQADILISDYRVLISLPSSYKGGDGIVVAVEKGAKMVNYMYRCSGGHSQTLYFLSRDESYLYSFQRRFSTFSVTAISTSARRAHQLQENGIIPVSMLRGSPAWLCNEILLRICIDGVDLLLLPPEISLVRRENLDRLCAILHNAHQNSNGVKLLAVMTLAMVHLKQFMSEDFDSLSDSLSMLIRSCENIMEWFPDGYIHNMALTLVRTGRSRSLTLTDKVCILIHADDAQGMEFLESCMSKESLYNILSFVINEDPSKILLIANGLLRRCKLEEDGHFSGNSVVPFMLWFSLISVQILHSHEHSTIVTSLLELFIQHAEHILSTRLCDDTMQQTVIHTGLFPMLVSVAVLCPAVVTQSVEIALLRLFDKLAKDVTKIPFLVSFKTKQACDVVPKGDDAQFRFVLDCTRATSVSIGMKMSSSEVTIITSDLSASKPMKFVLNNTSPFVKLSASSLVLFGTGETSLTIVCSYDLSVGTPWSLILRDAIVNLLLATARHLTAAPRPCDVFLAPLLRHGLSTKTLLAHGLDIPDRVNESTFTVDILNDVGDGKIYVDDVWENMRGCVTSSMRPAIRALLSLLIHSGLDPQLAMDEFRLRWFSGEWGSKLQGSGKDAARQSLVRLAEWITSCVYYQRDVSPFFTRCFSSRRRSIFECSLASRSGCEFRNSTNTRRSTVRGAMQSQETLDQVRAILTKDITTEELEKILVERTTSSLNTIRGLQLLLILLSKLDKQEMRTLHGILHVLWLLCGEGNGKHMIENFLGAGRKLEMCVRVAFHSVLEACASFLIRESSKDIYSRAPLTFPAENGASIILLLAIMCHPWDAVDCEFFKCNGSGDSITGILRHLSDLMSVLSYCMPLTSLCCHSQEQEENSGLTNEQSALNKLIGVLEYVSVNCILPNGFSVAIPNLQISLTEGVITFEKNFSGSLILRADEAWPMVQFMPWFGGIPRVFYYEVTLTSPCHFFALCLGQCRGGVGCSVDVMYFYENSGATHDIACPPFKEGDTIGCGVVATTREIFFTLNGFFISYMGTVNEKTESLFPTLRIDNRETITFTVNFGYAAFSYDFRRQHPAFSSTCGPSWYNVASTAEIVLHYTAARACIMQESFRSSAKTFLCKCCELVCFCINNVASSLMKICVNDFDSSQVYDEKTVMLPVAVSSLKIFISTLRHILQVTKLYPLPENIVEMVFNAVTVLMKISVHPIQMSTISFLPELLLHVSRVQNMEASKELVSTLFGHAKASTDICGEIPFVPYWRQCDTRCVAIKHLQEACMQPDAQRSIVLGGILPRTGRVSFTVRVFRKEMLKGHSLKGGYYIGIALANLTPLTPTSSSQGWKTAKPPVVWALHDISPQLPHATNPTVRPNIFHRAFGNGDAVCVVLDCDRQTLSYYRDDEFLNTLFTDIPSNVDLVPFVQLYNEDASVTISPGEMTAPISSSTLLGAVSVDVLRCMLTLKPFEHLVADGLCEELDGSTFPNVTLALFKSTPDPRVLQLCRRNGGTALVNARRLLKYGVKFSVGNVTYYEHINNLRTAFFLGMNGTFDVQEESASMFGVQRCVDSLVAALRRLIVPLVTTQALCLIEAQQRQGLLEEENNEWDYLFNDSRLDQFLCIQRMSQNIFLLEPPSIPVDYTFSAVLSHPGFNFPSRYCGRLATVPSGAENTTTPFIAIAEPAVPSTGRFNLRCQLMRGHTGQILGGGYYFGVCVSSFDWKRRDLSVGNPEVWAIHDMDDAPWRLRHLHSGTHFTPVDEPNCIIVSGDVIRLEIDRDEGTIHAYRKGINQEEVSMGLIFDNLPKDGQLFPFVHLFNTDASAVLLPSDGDRLATRTTVQQPHFVLNFSNAKMKCDGCVTQHIESRITPRVWYKCNECVDYNLCQTCFALCIHSHHSFTEMGLNHLVYATTPPKSVSVGMNVVIPGTTALYLKNWGCRMEEKHMNCVVESRKNNAVVMWGIVFKKIATLTVMVDTLNGELLCPESPMFIGLGEAEEIISLSPEQLREKCITGAASLVCLSSDSTLSRKINPTGLSPCGFRRGSTITIEVDTTLGEASIRCDWVTLGTQSFPTSRLSDPVNLVGFVLFGRENVVVSIYPELSQTLLAVVEAISNDFLCVSYQGRLRFIRQEHCRVPLSPCQGPPKVGTLGYVFVNKELVQCKVIEVEDDVIVIHFPLDNMIQRVLYSEFLTGKCEAIAEERLLHREVDEMGVTMNNAFVISRLLLILSYLCESETLSPYVLEHGSALLNILAPMAAVEIGNDAHMGVIQEVCTAVDMTCNCLRVMTRNRRLAGFKPSPTIGAPRYQPKENMLMCAVEGPHKGKMFKVVSVEMSEFFKGMELVTPFSTLILNSADCVPVKQCDGKPWWTMTNGVPCNMLEHTLRVVMPGQGSSNLSLGGMWQGDISVPRGNGGSISLLLEADISGVAEITFFPSNCKRQCSVFGEYMRYQRIVRLCLFCTFNSTGCRNFCFQKGEEHSSFEAAVEEVASLLSHEKNLDFVVVMDGVMDGEGQRISGEWKPRNDRSGTFTISYSSRTTLVPLTTELAHIEPLPECKDPVIPPPLQREMASTMHRLIVLLARHLYIFILDKTGVVGREIFKSIIHYHAHPLTGQIILTCTDTEQLLRTIYETLYIILDPKTKPWDFTSLSLLIAKSVLFRPQIVTEFPSVLLDLFHAVVAATHKCGTAYRHDLLKNVMAFVERYRHGYDNIYIQLLSPLLAWVDRNVSNFVTSSESRKDVAAGVELVMSVERSLLTETIRHIPLAPLQCLIDIAQSFREGIPLPGAVDTLEEAVTAPDAPPIRAICVFGEFMDGVLRVGKVMSSCPTYTQGKYYYEVIIPDRLAAPFVIGWGTEEHIEVPSIHVGSDAYSFAFTGNELTLKNKKEEYKPGQELAPGSVIGCLLDMDKKLVAWSVNGAYGPFVPIPIDVGHKGLYAFMSTGYCRGMLVILDSARFAYVPDGYSDISGRYTRVQIRSYDETSVRSVLPVRPISFYEQLASYLSDVEGETLLGSNPSNLPFLPLASSVTDRTETEVLSRYPLLANLNHEERKTHTKVIRVVESCMATARRLIDLDTDVVEGRLSTAFLFLKPIVRRSFGKKLLVSVPSVEKNNNPPNITVRITELYSTLPRTPEVALQHSVLSQIYKQIGSFTDNQFRQSPLFKVYLYIAGSGHVPQDYGGPYRQLWTFLSEELMTHPDKCYPHTDYHRNPLCRYLNNSRRVALVPDSSANSTYDLILLNFLGKIMGHAAVSNTPLALDFSCFVWKYLVEDPLTVKDYYKYVDTVVEKSMEDAEFLVNGMAEEIIPNLSAKLVSLKNDNLSEDMFVNECRRLAEECLVHSMDLQLNAIREGLWSVLPKRVARCLSWQELERMICGDSNLTSELMRQSIDVQLSGSREKAFWRIVDELSVEQRASFLCFACGQKRLPLIRTIKVIENTESTEHLPRAQSCTSLVTVPPYETYELFKEKLLLAISHNMEMELA